MDDLSLNSISGLYDLKAVGFGNYDGTTFNYYGAVNGENSRIYTQELRLTSSFDAPVNFMLGGYYEHSKRESFTVGRGDRKSTRLNSSHYCASRMPSSA